jgi:hypothetical protein
MEMKTSMKSLYISKTFKQQNQNLSIVASAVKPIINHQQISNQIYI